MKHNIKLSNKKLKKRKMQRRGTYCGDLVKTRTCEYKKKRDS